MFTLRTKLSSSLFLILASLLPSTVLAGDPATTLAYGFVQDFNRVILFPTIGLMSAIALLVFIFGCFQYVVHANDAAARTQGIKHITWGIIGLVVMLSAYTIMLLFANTFGLGDELNDANDGNTLYTPPGGGGNPTGGVPVRTNPTGGAPVNSNPQGGQE
jgi:uncharacterized membrane protein YjfL (UPF0719 family)